MLFWIITGLLTLVVVATLARAMMRGGEDGQPPAAYDLAVYRDQLKEVARDLERGVVSQADAERAQTEVSRRILAADAALQRHESARKTGRGAPVIAGAAAAIVIVGAFALYTDLGAPGYGDLALKDRIETAQILRAERPSQDTAEGSLPASPSVEVSPDYVALVEQLRTAIQTRPDDIQGFALLSQAETRLGNYSAAHAAKATVIALKGNEATATDYSEYADLMILAAGGYVSPEAEAALERTLAIDPTDGPARYYYGSMMDQIGRPDTALRIWDQLLRAGPPDAGWIAPITAQIDDLAARAGVNYARPAIGTGRGPTADDIQAAAEMSPTERMEMIRGMVSGLSDRLATEGGPVEDWAQLISALGTLGDWEQSRTILDNARDVFGDDPTAMDALARVADRVGLE